MHHFDAAAWTGNASIWMSSYVKAFTLVVHLRRSSSSCWRAENVSASMSIAA
jgi:hypothetical protein